ncbi:MAG: PAS domain S-box protein [Candidatus Dormibacteraeota bacterium]|nr:PAS domain S-box protein [Candidatus Dormibacteraeota bacterium]MBO0762448.1 PAS domain S-box protein [Candidatus Dormibacteraeota bacterium]
MEKQAEGRLLSLAEQAGLLDLAFDAILARPLSNPSIVYWNRGAELLYGWTRGEALGRTTEDLLGTEYPLPIEEIERCVRTTGSWEGQLVQHRRDGRQLVVMSRWATRLRAGSAPDLILEIDRDVTPRVEAERRLSQNDEMLGLLVSRVQEYAMFVLDPQGRIMTWNDGAQRLKQYTKEEILGRHFSVFYEEERVAARHPERELEMAERDGQYEEEGWRVRKDGTRFWASVLLTALRDEDGALRGFAKVTRDLSEKHAEAQRLAELEAVKSQFLRLASHELRGPLGTIRGYTSLLQEGLLESQPQARARAYDVLDTKARHMTLLVNQMLEAARLEDGRLQLELRRVDLRRPVEQAYEEARLLAPPALDLQLDQPGEPVLVEGDELRLVAVVQNLLDNAIKYSPEGGTVRCRVERRDGSALVEVSDQGVGIAEGDMPTLFTRFGRVVTSENSHIPGAGLGLYLCRELAQMHGGELIASSVEGQGSTFQLRLPLV